MERYFIANIFIYTEINRNMSPEKQAMEIILLADRFPGSFFVQFLKI